ncbi:Armadillo-like helical [Sesbania bispinosa]|nr:Armadillo-like helical [Sesbania bispinosa]
MVLSSDGVSSTSGARVCRSWREITVETPKLECAKDIVKTPELSAKQKTIPELSSTNASHNGDEDGQAIVSLELESKRRKGESYTVESNLSSRAVRAPRVVVQGNPNPRLLMVGTGSDKANEMLTYAHETQHEKIIRGLALGITLTVYVQ